MKKLTYFAVFEQSRGGYAVYFPQFPECISTGETFKATKKNATKALGLHLYAMEKDGEQFPEPSENPEIDPDTTGGYIISSISVYYDLVRTDMNNKAVKVNTTIPAWLKEVAEANNVNYSNVLQTALLEMFEMKK